MANTKKLIGAAAFSLALAGGGVAGALIGVPGTSGAQESTTTTEPADEVRHHRFGGPIIDAAAEALGMTTDELKAELESGTTIADVAGEKGVEVDTVVDAMVAAATEDIREHVTAIVNGEAPLGGRGHGPGGPGRPGRHEGFHVGLTAAAEALGLTEDELRAELEDGSTLAEVATEHGVEPQAVIDAMVAEISAHLDEKVADGELTQDEADARKAELTERITDLVNNGRPERGPGGPGPRP